MTEEVIQETFGIPSIIAGILILNFAASLLIFAQLGMRPLEKKLRALHKDTVSQWDAFGWRIYTYAIKLILPPSVWGKDGEYKMFLDPYVLQQIASRRERLLAFWLMGSLLLLMLYGIYYVRES